MKETAALVQMLKRDFTNLVRTEHGGLLDQALALQIISKAGETLIALHKKGIIHRGIAPQNLFVETGKDTSIRLFGLDTAKYQNHSDQVMGIIVMPGFSPIEQYDKQGHVGPWTDVYALGATLYLMLTGKKPDEATNRLIGDYVKAPHEINPIISQDISNAVMRAMAVNLRLRYQSVEEFLNAICPEERRPD